MAARTRPRASFVRFVMVEKSFASMIWLYAISERKGMPTSLPPSALTQQPLSLPEFVGRVAVLGGLGVDKSHLLVGLALRQIQKKGVALCLDGHRQKQTE